MFQVSTQSEKSEMKVFIVKIKNIGAKKYQYIRKQNKTKYITIQLTKFHPQFRLQWCLPRFYARSLREQYYELPLQQNEHLSLYISFSSLSAEPKDQTNLENTKGNNFSSNKYFFSKQLWNLVTFRAQLHDPYFFQKLWSFLITHQLT